MKIFHRIYEFFRYSKKGKALTLIERRLHKNGKCPYCKSSSIRYNCEGYESGNIDDLNNHFYECKECGFIVREQLWFPEFNYANMGFTNNKIDSRIFKLKKIKKKIENENHHKKVN